MIQPLNLRRALELNDVIGEFLPPNIGDMDVIEYAHQVIKNILSKGRPKVFVDALIMMTDVEFIEIVNMNVDERNRLFIEAIVENRLWHLPLFLSEISYGATK